jgi:hypothetical protein
MKNSIKSKTIAISLVILLTASIALMLVQPVQAAGEVQVTGDLPSGVTPSVTLDTSAHLSVRPNVIGVGQSLLINLWTSPATHAARNHTNAYVITITAPDGAVETFTLSSYPADATAWMEYVPEQTGTYQFQFDFLGTYFPAAYLTGGFMTSGPTFVNSAYYKPSSTPVTNITVQADMVSSWQSAMPTDYWTRPVHVENREWWQISGNFPPTGYVAGSNWDTLYPETSAIYNARAKFIPWVQGPDTSHIVWKRQGSIAGIIGGQAEQYGYSNSVPTPSIIYAGRAYDSYTKPGTENTYWRCYDVRTGEVYWEKVAQTYTTLWFGFFPMTASLVPNTIEYESPTQSEVAGAEAAGAWTVSLMLLSSDRLYKWDPWTGQLTCNVSVAPSGQNISSGTLYQNSYARDTSTLVYSIQTLVNNGATSYRLISWTTRGTSSDFASRVMSNTSYARSSLPSLMDWASGYGASVSGISVADAFVGETLTGYNLLTGAQIWTKNISEPMYSMLCDLVDHGKLATLSANGYYVCFDLATGTQLWVGDKMDYPWSSSGFGAYTSLSAYGMIIREAQDGVYAFNWTTGEQVWKYEAPANPFETPYTGANGTTVYPFYSFGQGGWIADGKVYTYTFEHTESWPVTRGWGLHCIDVWTGEGLWNITGCIAPAAIADGYLVGGNPFDGYTYSFGKGISETTIEAPMTSAALGSSIVIKGTVLDQSPAQPGTPCVSDKSMNEWMDYLHMQAAIPMSVIGVSVSLDAVDPNGNYIHIGDVNSDMSGTYGFTWTPEVAGDYKVTATFAGSGAYSSSWAQTHVSVVNAPAETAVPTATPISMPPFETYFAISTIAIIIAVALVGLFILRKHP